MKSCEKVKKSLLLYAVTERSYLGRQSLTEAVRQALLGGITMLQLREKHLSGDELYAEAHEIQILCRKFSVPFLLNDDVTAAVQLNADGAHIGQEDMEVQKARKLLGDDKILGVSAQTVLQAQKAEAAGADYLGVGAMFATPTKPEAAVVNPAVLRAICAAVDIPVVAIGGINLGNMPELSTTGIAGVAVVSAIFAQPDIKLATTRLRERAQNLNF